MAVVPIEWTDTEVKTIHAIENEVHEGSVPIESVRYATKIDGSSDTDVVQIECSVCGAISFHPRDGGSDPEPLKEAFARVDEKHG